MISRADAAIALSVGAVLGVSYIQWRITSPGRLTDTEWHLTLLVGGVALIITLSARWVGRGQPPGATDRDTYPESDNSRVIRPPWS